MEELSTLPVNVRVGEVSVKELTEPYKLLSLGAQSSTTKAMNLDPMKVHCKQNDFISNKAICWGPVEYITNEAVAPNQDETTMHVISVSQPVKIELPVGFTSTPHLERPRSASIPIPMGRGPYSEGVDVEFHEGIGIPTIRSGPATRKLHAPHGWAETQNPSSFLVSHQVNDSVAEEESTTCSDSDPEALANPNSEDDFSSGSERQQPPKSQLSFAKGQSEASPAHPLGFQPPPGIPSPGSALHGTGMCQPCAWFWKEGGCTNQGSCQHCHLCSSDELKARKKNKLIMMRLGLATPKSKVIQKEAEDKKTCELSFFLPEVLMPDILAPKEELMLSGPNLPDDATKLEATRCSEEFYPLQAKVDQNFLGPPPGLQPPASMPSHGSLLHGTGTCKPCAWFWKPGGCQKKQNCTHCHLCPDGEVKARKNEKLTMMRLGLATPKGRPKI